MFIVASGSIYSVPSRSIFVSSRRGYGSGNFILHILSLDEASARASHPICSSSSVSPQKRRRIDKLDAEGKAADVMIELTREKTKVNELGDQRYIDATVGVREYLILEPLLETMRSLLHGSRLENGDPVPLMGSRLDSEALGLVSCFEQESL